MSKKLSIEDLLRKMDSDRNIKLEESKLEEQRLVDMAERQRKEIFRVRSMYEKRQIVGVQSGGSLPSTTPEVLNGRSTIVLYKFGGTFRYFIYEYDNDFFSEEIDTEVPDTYGAQYATDLTYGNGVTQIQKGGYSFTLRGSGENIVFFIDSQGRLVEKITIPDSQRWTSNVTGWVRLSDGKFTYVVTNIGNDYTIYYFDGLKSYTTTVTADSVFLPDPFGPSSGSGSSSSFEVGSSTTLDGKLLWYYTNGTDRTYRLTSGGNDVDFITIDTSVSGSTSVNSYINGNFITTYNRNGSNVYQWIKIYDTIGNLILTEDVSGLNSTTLSWDNYGIDKAWFLFANGTTYTAYIYNNSNQTIVGTTQTSNRWDVSYRISNPSNPDTSAIKYNGVTDIDNDQSTYPYQIGLSKSQSILFTFYNYGGGTNGRYKNVTDCVFVPRFESETGSLRTINYVTAGDEYLTVGVSTTTSNNGKGGWFNTYTLSNDAIIIDGYENTGGDPFLKKFIITPTSSNTVTSTIDKVSTYLASPAFKKRFLGEDKLLYQYRTSTGTRMVAFNIDGSQDDAVDLLKPNFSGGVEFSYTNFVVIDTDNTAYYYTSFSTGFQNLNSDSVSYIGGGNGNEVSFTATQRSLLPDYVRGGNIIISDVAVSGPDPNGNYRIFTKDSISDVNTFPFLSGFSHFYYIGSESLSYWFIDGSGFVNVVIADLEGNVLHSLVTTDTRTSSFYNVGDRIYILTDTGNTTPATSYMLDPTGITQFPTVPKGTSILSFNDYIWYWI
jgi:hypothetical protein